MLKQKDLKRATLIEACIKGQCTVKQVALALGISERRVKQIKKEWCYKQMEQPFDWFENGEKYSLYGFIDDATGKITSLYMCKMNVY